MHAGVNVDRLGPSLLASRFTLQVKRGDPADRQQQHNALKDNDILPGGVTVARLALDQLVEVRILAGQPTLNRFCDARAACPGVFVLPFP